jgi:hypothetical protein
LAAGRIRPWALLSAAASFAIVFRNVSFKDREFVIFLKNVFWHAGDIQCLNFHFPPVRRNWNVLGGGELLTLPGTTALLCYAQKLMLPRRLRIGARNVVNSCFKLCC